MSDPVFATKWDFLFAQVLIGVDRATGVWSGSEPAPGQQLVAVWTSEEVATEALHVESWELRPIEVRDLLKMLPAGVGVIVDPERADGMTASASYIANLKQLLAPFPDGAALRITSWDDLQGALLREVRDTVAEHDAVLELHAFVYTVDDSPQLGCLALTFAPDAPDTTEILRRVGAVLPEPSELGVAAINVLDLAEVPAELRSAVPTGFRIYRRKRARPWRR